MSVGQESPLLTWEGAGGIPPAVYLTLLEDALEKLHLMLLAITVSRGSFCNSLLLSSGHGQWNAF